MPEPTLPPPTSSRGFFATSLGLLVLTYLGFVSLGLPDGVLGVAWPTLRADYGLGQRAFGAVLAAIAVGFLVSSLSAGGLLARFGAGVLLSASTAIVALGLVVVAASPSFPVVLLAALITGVGGGAIDAGLNAYAAGHYSARQMNWLHAAFGLGAGIGPAIMTVSLGIADWRLGYAVIAAVMAGMAVLFFATRHGFAGEVREASHGPVAPLGETLRNPLVLIQTLTFFIYVGTELTAGQWAYAVFLARGFSVDVAGGFVSAYWFALFAGRLALGFGADRIGPDRLIRYGALAALLGAVLFLTDPAGLAPFGLILIGFSVAPIYPMLMHRTPAVLGPRIGPRAIGLQVSAAMVGAVAIPSLAGFAADAYGLGAPPVVVVASAVLLVVLVELTLRLGRPPLDSASGPA